MAQCGPGRKAKPDVTTLLLIAVAVVAGPAHGTGHESGWTAPVTACIDCAATISVDPSQKLQSITGWEATTFSFQASPAWPNFTAELFDRAVNELGIDRVRLEVRSGAENDRDHWSEYMSGTINYTQWRAVRYSTINDNGDPNSLDPAGFHFAEMDWTIDNIVLPLMRRLEAKGERLWINLNYVAFTGQIGPGLKYVHNDTKEYAEFVLAVFGHMKQKYGWVPDTWEIILEPDNVQQWRSGAQIGKAIVDAAARLKPAGHPARFVAPSNTNMANAITYFDDMVKVQGVLPVLEEFSYHRYGGVSDANLRAIGNRSVQHKVNTSHLEHIGSGYQDLHKDLRLARNSAWSQYTLAGGGSDDGGKYYLIDDSNPAQPKVSMGSRTKFLWQYFHFVRRGAAAVESTTADANFDPVAFVNQNGSHVVVVNAAAGGKFTVVGLPAGAYGMRHTTSSQHDVSSPDVAIAAGEWVNASIPSAGVITIHQKGVGGGQNNAPAAPKLAGPTTGKPAQALSFSVTGSDPDNEQVSHTVDWGDGTRDTSSPASSGTAATLSHAWVAIGSYQVKAKSTDARGAESNWGAAITVSVTNAPDEEPPAIQHNATKEADAGKPITLQATITDDVGVTSAALFFKPEGAGSFTKLDMNPVGATTVYQETILAAYVKAGKLEYYIEARDAAGNIAASPGDVLFPYTVDVKSGGGTAPSAGWPPGEVAGLPVLLLVAIVSVAVAAAGAIVAMRRRPRREIASTPIPDSPRPPLP